MASTSTRTVSPAGPLEFLITIPDKPNSLEARLKVREKHLEELEPFIANGTMALGGAILSAHPDESKGEKPDMTGSCLILKCRSEEEARKWVLGDLYATAGVWDTDKMTVRAFRSAVRTAK